MNGWLIFALLALVYGAILFNLRGRGPLPGGFEVNGPFIFWRTQLGKKAIQKVAQPVRFWNAVADAGIVLTWLMGIAIFALLIQQLYLYFAEPEIVASSAVSPEFLIGLPGINPLIPLGSGLLALILALVIHEGSHGVMAYASRMRVKSLGLVNFIVPIGAFVEPDEEDLAKATTREKNRVFAAGPTSNIVLATVAGIILSTAFLGNLAIANDGEGVVVGIVEPGSAAHEAGLQSGDIMTRVAGQSVATRDEYTRVMNNTRAGEQIPIEYIRQGAPQRTEAVLGDKWEYVERVAPEFNTEDNRGKGFLGVTGLGLDGINNVKEALQSPFSSLGGFLLYISYPFLIFQQGIDVLAPPYSGLFEIQGPMAALPPAVFFGTATLLYWIVWINIMLGTFNALPAGPLDGGQMFRATLSDRLMRRYNIDRQQVEVERPELGGPYTLRGKDAETQAKLDRIHGLVSRTTMSLGLFILGLILLPLFGPPLLRLII